MTIYTVHRGDSLYGIARRFGTKAETIGSINGLRDPSGLSVGQALLVPSAQQNHLGRSILVNGYLTRASASLLERTLPYLSFLSPFSCKTDEYGELHPDFDVPTDRSASYATANLLTITNLKESGGFSSDIAHSILTQADVQDNFLENVIAALEVGDWYGVNLDFEYISPYDKESYNQFLRRFSEKLHELGYLLITALAPKLSENQSGLLYTAHDYAAHGKVSDYVVLMTYEWGYTYGPAMAVAPLNMVRRVLDYAVSAIPASKVLLGIPNYGYDWTLPFQQGTAAKPLSAASATALAGKVGAEIQFSQSAKSPFFRYRDGDGKQHEVWFEDARSLHAKYQLVNEYGLAGISFWNLNAYNPTNFELLQDMYAIEKVL